MSARTTFLLRVAIALAVALAVVPAAAEPRSEAFPWFGPEDREPQPEVVVTTRDGARRLVRRCATPVGPAEARAEVEAALDLWRSLGGGVQAVPKRTIPVAVHVVRQNPQTGEVTDQQILDQIEVLNRGFKKSAFRFELASVDRTDRKKWHRKCFAFNARGGIRAPYRKMTKRLAVDPSTTLNLYTCDLIRQNVLGFAMLPWYFLGESPLDAVVVDYRTLPDGDAVPYDEGDTAVHEVGHWLGLYHTFQGGCAAPGDEVADTPYEAEPAFGCPIGRDTCTDDPGLDPVTNYMDYSDDACLVKLSKGQRKRVKNAVDLYRPGLGNP